MTFLITQNRYLKIILPFSVVVLAENYNIETWKSILKSTLPYQFFFHSICSHPNLANPILSYIIPFCPIYPFGPTQFPHHFIHIVLLYSVQSHFVIFYSVLHATSTSSCYILFFPAIPSSYSQSDFVFSCYPILLFPVRFCFFMLSHPLIPSPILFLFPSMSDSVHC